MSNFKSIYIYLNLDYKNTYCKYKKIQSDQQQHIYKSISDYTHKYKYNIYIYNQ